MTTQNSAMLQPAPEALVVRATGLLGQAVPRDVYALITLVEAAMRQADNAMNELEVTDENGEIISNDADTWRDLKESQP